MKIRYLTLVTTLVCLGFTVSAFAKGKPNPPVVPATYDITISGDVTGASDTPWGYDGNQVYSPSGRHENINLDYFRTIFNDLDLDDGKKGENCFGSFHGMTKFGGFLSKHRKETAVGMFWFHGFTGDKSASARKEVLYLLQVSGVFVGDPTGWPENENLMEMRNWTLKVENQGKNVALRSCEDSGEWTEPEDIMIVAVTEPKIE